MPRILAYDPAWPVAFAAEAEAVRGVAGDALTLHHIGSTAVPGLSAKPVIDMLGIVGEIEAAEVLAAPLARLGYQAMGEYGIEGRRYFRRDDEAGRRARHLHIFAQGSPHITRHLAFRDYLRAHPDRAEAYGALKLSLAGADDYQQAKAGLAARLEAEALAWAGRAPDIRSIG